MAIAIRTGLQEPETGQDFVPHRPKRPEKAEGGRKLRIVSDYEPAGDQPTAIAELVASARQDEQTQVLLGVTGSGKTFTMAKVIEALQRPASSSPPTRSSPPSSTASSRASSRQRGRIFRLYYDYYQPEAYVPRSDTYIEKESSVNEAIDRMRHSATRALLERDDVIIVASVSCLYGIGSVETYSAMTFSLKKGDTVDQREIIRKLVALQYKRNDQAFARGNFRVRGDNLEIFPRTTRTPPGAINFFGDEIEEIVEFDPLTGKKVASLDSVKVYANSHYVTPGRRSSRRWRRSARAYRAPEGARRRGQAPRAQRLEQRTNFDLEMIAATGSCAGSRITAASSPAACPASRRRPVRISARERLCSSTRATRRCRRSAPWRAATTGARSRSPNMASACPPASTTGRCASTSGTRCARRPSPSRRRPALGDGADGGVFAEQVIRPTGLIDPPVEIKPVEDQVDDLITRPGSPPRRATAPSSPRSPSAWPRI
jgi:excinuclease ABC subunit B